MSNCYSDLIAEIRPLLKEINIVSFSGGKDSSVVLQSVLAAIAGTSKKLFIMTADTLMEIPYFQEYLNRTKSAIKTYIQAAKINAELITVYPDPRHTFWVSILGMGYPAAHMGFRWCTKKLKIAPISNFIEIITFQKEYTCFIGVRRAESALRARIYQRKDFKPNYYAPILNWTAYDVWGFLMTEPCPWGDHSELIKVYKYSSDECVYGEKQGVCVGNARYGCWACPLQKSSQLDLIGFHTGEVKRYQALKDFKNILVNTANNTAYRSRIRRNGKEGPGPFLVSIRQKLYAKLKRLEIETGWHLITKEEENLIFNHWEIDRNIHHVAHKFQPMLFSSEPLS